MKVLSKDDKNINPMLVKWSISALWIYDILNNPEIASQLSEDAKTRGWKIIQEYNQVTSLL